MSDRYKAALTRLAAESSELAPPPDLESALLREFDRTRRSRRLRPRIAPAAAAAAVAVLWFLRPQPVATLQISQATPVPPWSALPPPAAENSPAPAPAQPPPRAGAPPAESESPFTPIPYVAPIDPYERIEVVRMDLPVSALIAAGLRIQTDDAGASVQADVMVGQDGRARAIRLVSISDFN
jgi:hypothetical protein